MSRRVLSPPHRHRHHDNRQQPPQQHLYQNKNPYPPDDLVSDYNSQRYHHHHHHHKKKKKYQPAENVTDYYSTTTDSGSTRIPVYHDDNDEEEEDDLDGSRRFSRFSRNTTHSSEPSFTNPPGPRISVHKDPRRVYPIVVNNQKVIMAPVAATMATSDRTGSSPGGVVVAVDGCGGKCQTFENVCYFFLQLVFMMCTLIGVSLCIAGLVLRKSAARNLQVFVYIGIMLAAVSSLLLGIQWKARNDAKRRKNAKRAPIPMEILRTTNQEQPLVAVVTGSDHRVVSQVVIDDQQGVPWWRRRDLI